MTPTAVVVAAAVLPTAVVATVAVMGEGVMVVRRRAALVGDGDADADGGKRSEKRKDKQGRTAGWGHFDSSSGVGVTGAASLLGGVHPACEKTFSSR